MYVTVDKKSTDPRAGRTVNVPPGEAASMIRRGIAKEAKGPEAGTPAATTSEGTEEATSKK